MITWQAVNMMINYLNTSSETKCWDSIDISVDVYHYEEGGAVINAVPSSISMQFQEYGRGD